MKDLRPLLFEKCSWYPSLAEDTPDHWVLWRVTKSNKPAWWRGVLIAAAAFARDHDLLPHYQSMFAGVRFASLADSAGEREQRAALFPLWEIAYELIAAAFLEHALGWTFVAREPTGHQGRVGDWEFRSSSGRVVFVEVKSVLEPEPRGGVFMRGVASERVTAILRGAYRQLPRDSRATLVLLVGNGFTTALDHEVTFTDLFQTLFGRTQVKFKVMPYVEGSEQVGPSFYDTFAHSGKHRRLGCAAALHVSGNEDPGLVFYAIHNPYADAATKLEPGDFKDTVQFYVDERGHGEELGEVDAPKRWFDIASGLKLHAS